MNAVKASINPASFNTENATSPCGTLGKLPLELRNMVYKKVLMYDRGIRQANRFLNGHLPIMAEESRYIEAIDATLLRTSRAIYQEAISILYGKNLFIFRKSKDIEDFAHLGLRNTPFGFYRTPNGTASAGDKAPYGRLTMICSLDLSIAHKCVGDDRKKIWSFWYDFFYPPEEQEQLIGFPALRRLCLDFTDWRLNAEESSQVRVRPISRII